MIEFRICPKTMSECRTPGMCNPYGGCLPEPTPAPVGWICPRCQTVNAPFSRTCGGVGCNPQAYQVTCATEIK